MEEWKTIFINDKETTYQISSLGRSRNLKNIGNKKEGFLSPRFNKSNGYNSICIRLNGEKFYRYVHRLVAENFLSNARKLPQVNHKDGNKINNIVENLEWCDQKYNMQHCFENSLCSTAKPVDVYTLEGKFLQSYISISSALKDLGIKCAGLNSECFFDVAKQNFGYQWRFKDSTIEVNNLSSHCKMFSKRVVKTSLTGEYIRTYQTLTEAYKDLNKIDNGTISQVCKGRQKSAYGYKWHYEVDYYSI